MHSLLCFLSKNELVETSHYQCFKQQTEFHCCAQAEIFVGNLVALRSSQLNWRRSIKSIHNPKFLSEAVQHRQDEQRQCLQSGFSHYGRC